ncbi:MAG: Gfo/Idh/MocA family oxidoreductase [Candidatus Pacebacteria bacterium]|nr:Gfo/Idh/MocA family oxidoreductase [Candidatus Paceibacterota bacterium]
MNKKFAIIGKGFIYNLHEEAIAKIAGEIVDIIDQSNGPNAWKEMVKKTKADCIVILSPNNLHFEMAKFSAENGKIVLCEKPLALKSEETRILTEYPDIFTVYQLRHHPSVKELKSKIKENENYQIGMDVSVHRDEDYWKSWKGKMENSGGIIFNLGIHYFDLILYLFGEPTEISTQVLTEKKGEGVIKGKNYLCNWKISAEAPKEDQCRVFKINGINYDFSPKENLHFYVYKDLLEKKGIVPGEALKSIELIEQLYKSS